MAKSIFFSVYTNLIKFNKTFINRTVPPIVSFVIFRGLIEVLIRCSFDYLSVKDGPLRLLTVGSNPHWENVDSKCYITGYQKQESILTKTYLALNKIH